MHNPLAGVFCFGYFFQNSGKNGHKTARIFG
jgi:hypothetical protein